MLAVHAVCVKDGSGILVGASRKQDRADSLTPAGVYGGRGNAQLPHTGFYLLERFFDERALAIG